MNNNQTVYTCSKHNYSGINAPCPDCITLSKPLTPAEFAKWLNNWLKVVTPDESVKHTLRIAANKIFTEFNIHRKA